MNIVDSHAHLSCSTIREEIDLIIKRAQAAGVAHIVNICTNPAELAHARILTQRYPWIKIAGSTTPHDIAQEGKSAFATFEEAALAGELVAVGETGLDYFYPEPMLQQEFLRRYLQLAKRCTLPLVIHCREAFEDLFRIFDEEYGSKWEPGILHCFTGSFEEAQRLVAQGWMLSFSGIITFKKSALLREVVKSVPLDHIIIETDTPYLAPQSKRGQRNEPAYIIETARCVAEVKGLELATFTEAIARNIHSIFKIS